MDNYCSPQWVDFTSTPDVPTDDYFDINHEIYECKPYAEVPKIETKLADKVNIEELSKTRTNNETLETELNIIKNTPIKVIYSPASLRNSSKCKATKKITYDDVLNEAIEVFEHCMSAKLDTFKKPVPIKNDVSKSSKLHAVNNNKVKVLKSVKIQQVTDGTPNREIKSLSSTNIRNSYTSSNNMLENSESDCKSDIDNSAFYTPVNCMKSLKVSVPSKQEQCLSLEKGNSNKRLKPVTYQCRRKSLIIRRPSNQFVSLAAAVHKFQNETPERFHTKCNKDLKIKPASAKRHSFVTRTSMSAKSNIKRRSVPALTQKQKKDLKSDGAKEVICDKTSPKHVRKTPNVTKPRRSYLNCSTKNIARNKHVVSTIVNNNGSEIVLKKEKILFFDIPIHTKQKATTRPIPFSFEYRDKVKKPSKPKQSELEDNKSVDNVKSQDIGTKVSEKGIRISSVGIKNKARSSIIEKSHCSNQLKTNGEVCKGLRTTNISKNNFHNKSKNEEKKLSSTGTNLKGGMISLEPNEKTEDKNENNEHSLNEDTEQLKEQSMSFKNSFDKRKDISKDKNTQNNTQTKHISQVKKQSSSLLCKEKIKSENKKIEIISSKEDLNKTKKKLSTNNSIDADIAAQENKCPNINASTSDKSLNQTKNVKPTNTTIGMNSYERGKQRHEYDEKRREKIKMQEEIYKKMEADKLAQEKLQITKLRKQLEVKARPMPIYKPLFLIKSTKPLTEPHSPAWNYKKTKKAM